MPAIKGRFRLERRAVRFENNGGFTLIELAVVVMIIGLLAAIVVPQYATQADRAKDGVIKTELKAMQNAVELYFIENGNYPGDETTLEKAFSDYGVSWPGKDPYGGDYAYYYNTADDTYYIISGGSRKTSGSETTVVYCSQSVEPTRGQEPTTTSYTKILTEGSES